MLSLEDVGQISHVHEQMFALNLREIALPDHIINSTCLSKNENIMHSYQQRDSVSFNYKQTIVKVT